MTAKLTLPADAAGPGELIRDQNDWAYPGLDGRAVTRRLRVWRMAPRAVVAVLTEPYHAPGTSITNAAADIRLRLEREYPTDLLVQVEHYPAAGNPAGPGAEHWDVVEVTPGHDTRWARLHPADLAARLPGLIEAPPAGADPAPEGVDAAMWALTAGLGTEQLDELAAAAVYRRAVLTGEADGP